MRQHFTGYERDAESGLDYAQARYYSNQQGRFTSVDPLGKSASVLDPQSFNRYTYVLNGPVNLTDPEGLMAGADQGWSSVASGFFGSSAGFNRPNFGGPETIGAALMANQSRMNDWLSRLRNGGEAGLGGENVIVTNVFAFHSRQDAIRYYEKEYGGPVFQVHGKFYLRTGIRRYTDQLPFNPVKLFSAGVGFANTGRKLSTGYQKIGVAFGIEVGTRMTAHLPAAVVGAWGAWDLWGAGAAYNRANQQWNEALSEKGSDGHWRNLLGPLPLGQFYDDPNEPGPGPVLKEKARKPLEFIREIASITP